MAHEGDVVDELTTDHREATELIAEIRSAAPEQQRDLATQLIAELVRHSVAEEMWVYPAMRKHLPDGDAAVEHDTAEHKELEASLKALESAEPGEPAFLEALGKVEEVLADHVRDEETEQFPKLRTHLPADELQRLKEHVETAKKVAPTRPHPMSPNNKLFHLAFGPGVGLVDKLRDAVTGRATS